MASVDAEAMEVEVEEERPAVEKQVFTLPLLQFVKAEQAQNGVAHSDYRLYRKRCGSKLRSICKLLKFQHGRTKYQKRKIEAATVTDVRFLHLLVFYSERAWAYAMQLKKENEQDLSLMRRNHLIRRLRKAKCWAEDLVAISSQCCDSRSQLEAEAYAAWLHGCLLLEQETNWTMALSQFTRALMLYEGLSKVVPMDQQTLCFNMIDDIKTSSRYCGHKLERKGQKAPMEAQLLVESDPDGQAGIDALKAQLDALTAEAQQQQQQQVATSMMLEWQGRSYPVHADRVRACLHQANDYASKLATAAASSAPLAASSSGAVAAPAAASAAASSSEPEAGGSLLALYTRMINSYNEAKSHVRNALKASSAAEGDAQYQELLQLEMAIQGVVLERGIERSRLLLQDAEDRFTAGMERLALGKRAREKDKYAKAEDVVRLLEALSRGLSELGELGARLGGRQGEDLHERCAASAQQAQARRAYYIAQALLAADKPLEAYAVFGAAAQRVEDAKQRLGEASQGAGAAAAAQRRLEQSELERTAALIQAYRAVAHAEQCAVSSRAQESLQQGVGSMSLSEPQPQAQPQPQGYLIDQLDTWESFAGLPGSKAPRIFQVPFAMQSIPMRPIMLDTASNFIEYPSLEHRYKKQDKKSMLSSLFGWGAKK